jgi:hypothetical protein
MHIFTGGVEIKAKSRCQRRNPCSISGCECFSLTWRERGCRGESVTVYVWQWSWLQSGNGHFLAYIPFHNDGKFSPAGGGGGGTRPPPFTLCTITCKVWCIRSSWEGTYTLPLFLLYPYMYSVELASFPFVHKGPKVSHHKGTVASDGFFLIPSCLLDRNIRSKIIHGG